MRLAYYAGASTAAAAACLLKAFHQRPNFYSATVYLSQSNACLLIITNLLLVLACGFMFALQRLLYGPLRPIEIEQLSEKAWYAVLDTLLAMPSFREDVGGWLLTMFVLLLAGKVWGWIGEGRVDILEQQPPANPRLFHARLASSLVLSVLFDAYMLKFCVESVIAKPGPGMMVIFLFEFAILLVFSVFTLLRYQLSVVDSRIVKQQTEQAIEVRKAEIRAEREATRQSETEGDSAGDESAASAPAPTPTEDPIEVDENEVDVPGWEEKRRYLFALEVLTDFVKLMIYIVFFTVSVTFNGLPMHIMRDVYMTFASFSKRVSDYVAYRKATSDMNLRYPDATTEEIRGDACIVCRESMVAWEQPSTQDEARPAADQAEQAAALPAPPRRRDEGLRAKKLPCGHILHLRCLKAWLERQQVCPTCRRPVVTAGAPEAAPGAAPEQGAPGQPGARPPQARHRARFFNLGPLRVGLLNGPEDQIRNALNQANQQDGGNQNVPPPQSPNHLGLQVPYGNAQATGQGNASTRGTRAPVPIQIQLMQMEQRLIQEAHNLGIEQQQLMTLRRMEAEMARLRAQHIPSRAMAGSATAPRIDGQQHVPAMAPFHAPQFYPQQPTMLHGNATQQLSNGNALLPEGLVLPAGWTAMPLRPAGIDPVPYNQAVPPVDAHTSIPAQPNPGQPAVADGTAAPTSTITAAANVGNTLPHSDTFQATGPTDDRGSPLFVPTQVPHNGVADVPILPQTQGTQQPPLQPAQPLNQPAQREGENKAPWAADNNWSFDQPPTHSAANPSEQGNAPVLNGIASNGTAHAGTIQESAAAQNHDGKGKARAVEVEEAPDDGN